MPYQNEWSARQDDPKRFVGFRRKNNGFSVPGLDVIYGIPAQGSVKVQSLRFRKSLWSKQAATRWLREHGFLHNIE